MNIYFSEGIKVFYLIHFFHKLILTFAQFLVIVRFVNLRVIKTFFLSHFDHHRELMYIMWTCTIMTQAGQKKTFSLTTIGIYFHFFPSLVSSDLHTMWSLN